MSLLSGLLSKTPNAQARPDTQRQPVGVKTSVNDGGRGRVMELPTPHSKAMQASAHSSAATATPEWRQARDSYINHLMACSTCYAPGDRHCLAGAQLRAIYDLTPMEI